MKRLIVSALIGWLALGIGAAQAQTPEPSPEPTTIQEPTPEPTVTETPEPSPEPTGGPKCFVCAAIGCPPPPPPGEPCSEPSGPSAGICWGFDPCPHDPKPVAEIVPNGPLAKTGPESILTGIGLGMLGLGLALRRLAAAGPAGRRSCRWAG